jgi:hypothetical protein
MNYRNVLEGSAEFNRSIIENPKRPMTTNDDNHPSAPGSAFHRFPDFNDRGSAASGGNDVPGGMFRPLFREGSVSDTHSVADRRRSANDDRLESVRQKGYAMGFEAGRQEACQSANHLLVPHVDRFRRDLEHLTTYQQHVADHASTHIIALAIAISERIMGAEVRSSVDNLEPIRKSLIDAICRHHQLQLRYHPDDLAGVQHLMDCQGPVSWESMPGLDISSDSSMTRGELLNRHRVDEGKSFCRHVQASLQQVLQLIESQRPPAQQQA